MARALKTYLTSIGFFDLAIAAPSMKAALEAWGVRRNLFHEGTASETDEPAIVKATMAKPGLVLKRAIGTRAVFEENAALPTELPALGTTRRAEARKPKRHQRTETPSPGAIKAQKAAVIQFGKERALRERNRALEEAGRATRDAAEAREEKQRQRELGRIQAQIDKARERHEKALAEIRDQRDALDRKSEAENRRWALEKKTLENELQENG